MNNKQIYRKALNEVRKFELILSRLKGNQNSILNKLKAAQAKANAAAEKLNLKQRKVVQKPFKNGKSKIKGFSGVAGVNIVRVPKAPKPEPVLDPYEILKKKQAQGSGGDRARPRAGNPGLQAMYKDIKNYFDRSLSNSESDLYYHGYEYARDDYFEGNGLFVAKREMAIMRIRDLISKGRTTIVQAVEYGNGTPDVREHDPLVLYNADISMNMTR